MVIWRHAHSVISCQGPDFLCRGPALSYCQITASFSDIKMYVLLLAWV